MSYSHSANQGDDARSHSASIIRSLVINKSDRHHKYEKTEDRSAWLQVRGAFFLNFNTWGLLNAFEVFQAEYSAGLLSRSSQSAISWIGSIQAFLMLVVGVLCGRALDAGYFCTDITVGVFLEVFGMMSEFRKQSRNP